MHTLTQDLITNLIVMNIAKTGYILHADKDNTLQLKKKVKNVSNLCMRRKINAKLLMTTVNEIQVNINS